MRLSGTWTSVPTWEVFASSKITGLSLVAESPHDGVVAGWVPASPVSSRPVHAGVVEHNVYVAPTDRGRGLGRVLLEVLLAASEDAGVWTVQTSHQLTVCTSQGVAVPHQARTPGKGPLRMFCVVEPRRRILVTCDSSPSRRRRTT